MGYDKHGNFKHGHSYGSLAYHSWKDMRKRCNNPNQKDYHNYGGRGITICERWDQFSNFLEDMGDREQGMTLDRIDPDGNYEPGNCRWATRKEQMRNQRRVKLTQELAEEIRERLAAGEKQRDLADWYGVNHRTISAINRGVIWND